MKLEFKVVDENIYSINGIDFNYSKFIKSQGVKTSSVVDNYKYNKSYETLGESLMGKSIEENKGILKEISDRINNIEQLMPKVDEYLNLIDINEIHVLRLVNTVCDKKYKDVSKVGEEVKKLDVKELSDTYSVLSNYDKYVHAYGSMSVELNNLYNCKNIIKKQLTN
jgi:hypothetical protein